MYRQWARQNEKKWVCTKQNNKYQTFMKDLPAGNSANVMVLLEHFNWHQIYDHKNVYQLKSKDIIAYLGPWKVNFIMSYQSSSCGT